MICFATPRSTEVVCHHVYPIEIYEGNILYLYIFVGVQGLLANHQWIGSIVSNGGKRRLGKFGCMSREMMFVLICYWSGTEASSRTKAKGEVFASSMKDVKFISGNSRNQYQFLNIKFQTWIIEQYHRVLSLEILQIFLSILVWKQKYPKNVQKMWSIRQ